MNFIEELKMNCSSQLFRRGEQYYEDGNVIKLVTEPGESNDTSSKNEAYFMGALSLFNDSYLPKEVDASVKGSHGMIHNPHFYIVSNTIIDCDCDCAYFAEHEDTCQHVVAAAFEVFFRFFPSELPYKGYQKKSYRGDIATEHSKSNNNNIPLKELMQKTTSATVINNNNKKIIDSLILHKKNPVFLKINGVFIQNNDNSRGIVSTELELVTSERNYKLESKLESFLSAYNLYELNFGKAYTYNPKTDYFQGWDKKFIEFLRECKELTGGSSYGSYGYYRHKNLYSVIASNLDLSDRFLDILAEGNFIKINLLPLKIIMTIDIQKETDTLVNINFSNLDNIVIMGRKTITCVDNTPEKYIHFCRMSEDEIGIIKELKKSLIKRKSLTISTSDLPTVVSNLDKIGVIDISEGLEDFFYTPKKVDSKIYIDSYDNHCLKITQKMYYDGKESNDFKDTVIIKNGAVNDELFPELISHYEGNIEGESYHITNPDNIYNFITEEIPKLQEKHEVFYSEAFKKKKYASATYSVSTKVDDILEIKFSVDNIDKSEIASFLAAVKEKKKYYILKNGSILKIDNDQELENLAELLDVSEASKKEIESGIISRSKNYGYFIRTILKKMENVSFDDGFEKLELNFKNAISEEELEKVKGLCHTLRDYQLYGISWLLTLKKIGLGGILADDMGLGKTLQTILYLSQESREGASLIVAPKSLIYNWKSEFSKFYPDLNIVMAVGNKTERKKIISQIKDKDIIISTYSTIKNDIDIYNELPFKNGFVNIIIDEAQNIKNIMGKTSNAIKELKGETKIALTGTPIENNIMELWSIFDFIFPGYLGTHLSFKRKYQDDLSTLRKIIEPFILRRTKSEVLTELPEKIEQTIFVELEEKQKKIYLAYLEKYKQELEEDKSDAIKILSCLTRLRQICNHPKLILEDYTGESAKLEALLELLHESKSGGHRVLLFSQFTEMLKIIRENLEDDFNILYLDGKTKVEDRLTLVNRFNSGEGDIFIISLKAGGSGLNLTGADTVIHYDPWWNPSIENQATDRAHRMWQKKVVNVFKLITKGTIEEKINLIKDEKSKIISEILDGEKSDLLKMNREELLKLF